MKVLVLSDSHAALSFMRLCIDKVKPQHVIHLGDHYDDGKAMAEEYPQIPFPNAATRKELVHKFLDLLLMGAIGAGLAVSLLFLLVIL